MGVKQGKKWGVTEALLENEQVQVHRITFKPGVECSRHIHKARYNAFYVLSGKLRIDTWPRKGEKSDLLVLTAGEFTTIPPGLQHCFEGMTHGEALEIYYPAPVRADDIERSS